ncbi:MAG: DNA-entry nuclease [Lysinibacillus sp.]
MESIEISYDNYGRMLYHPEFHFAHGKTFSESDLEYICKFYEVDHTRNIAFAIGKTEHTIRTKVSKLQKEGLFNYYKNLNKHW